MPRARVIRGDDSEAGSNILDVAFCTRIRLTTAPEIENPMDRGPLDIYATPEVRRPQTTKRDNVAESDNKKKEQYNEIQRFTNDALRPNTGRRLYLR